MADRLDDIKARNRLQYYGYGVTCDDVRWLVAEVERLREAIQAALDSPNHMSSEDIEILLAALKGEGR